MQFLDTPDSRFQELDDYPFTGKYFSLESGMRVHYVDEGPEDAAETVLLMHGEPSWSYLYRFMIPPLVEAGYRCLAPDLIGFGKSSKPTKTSDYTYERHEQWMQTWLEGIDVNGLTLFCQDWGGLIGLRLVANVPDRFSRVVVSNTFLPAGMTKPSEAFLKWQAYSQRVEKFPFEFVIQGATTRELTDQELAAYRAPYPSEEYTAGARIFPALVPTEADDPEALKNKAIWANTYTKWEKPLLTLFGDSDPVTSGGNKYFEKVVPGAKGQDHSIIKDGGHFIQEDKGSELAEKIIQFIQRNP